jgi:hypothetical protein
MHKLLSMVGMLMIVFLLLEMCYCEIVTYPNTRDYNYSSTVVLNISDVDDDTYEINTNFDIYFQNKTYRTFYVSTNSYVIFQDISYIYYDRDRLTLPGIMIEAQDNIAISLTVKITADNITVYYKGYNYNS